MSARESTSGTNLATVTTGGGGGGDNDGDDGDIVYQASSSNFYSTLDLSNTGIETLPSHYAKPSAEYSPKLVKNLITSNNRFSILPLELMSFVNLTSLDVSSNGLTEFTDVVLCSLSKLQMLVARNNVLDESSFPKSFAKLTNLESLNLSGNVLEQVPHAVFELPRLRHLYLGANCIYSLPCKIGTLMSLEVLYLGGNRLHEVPATIGQLKNLSSLALCDNQLETIPSTIAHLQALESLSLHNNLLKTLPTEIVKLRNLQQLSLRNNPLVHQFVRDMAFDPPSLKELGARSVSLQVPMELRKEVLPSSLIHYMDTANQCVNPKCKGVYFEACVEHIKFVDFCGKFRVPLLQYLCSPRCSTRTPAYAITTDSSATTDSEMSTDEAGPSQIKLKKVLLG